MSVNYIGPFDSPRDWGSVEHLMIKLTAQHSATMKYSTRWCKPPMTQSPLAEPTQLATGAKGAIPLWLARSIQPVPMPLSTSAPVDDAIDDIAERLCQGMLAQENFIKGFCATRVDEDKQTHSYPVTGFASLGVPAWVKPGIVHKSPDYHQVAMEKATLSWEMMKALITPYFSVPPFLKGMERLHSLFKGDVTTKNGRIFWKPPEHVPTYQDVIEILEEILDGLTERIEPYPTTDKIMDGRMRYQAFLESGRFPQFLRH